MKNEFSVREEVNAEVNHSKLSVYNNLLIKTKQNNLRFFIKIF